jgi:hypothetical protein
MARAAFPQAARAYLAQIRRLPPTTQAVQLLVACSDETVQKAMQNAPSPQLFVVPYTLKGRSCYRLCWGTYESSAQAEAGRRAVPDYFVRGGAQPRVVSTRDLIP